MNLTALARVPGRHRIRNAAPERTLGRNVVWTLGGTGLYAACQWAMLVVIARLGTPGQVGQFALGLAVSAPVMLLASLSLRTIQATDAARRFAFVDYLGLRIVTASVGLLTVIIIAIAGPFRAETALIIIGMGTSKAIESLSDVLYGMQQHQERMRSIAVSLMLRGVLALVAMTVVMAVTGSVLVAVLALAGAWAAVLIRYDLPSARSTLLAGQSDERQGLMRPRFDRTQLSSLVMLALPFGISTMLGSLSANIPRYFIERSWGERELGIFAALAYLIIAGNTVVAAVAQSTLPRLSQLFVERRLDAYRSLLVRLIGFAALLGSGATIAAMIAGRPALRLAYGGDYAAQSSVLIWLALGGAVGFVGYILDMGMFAAQQFRRMLPLNAIVCGVTALGCWFLVEPYGLRGAAWAMLAALVAQNLIEGMLVWRLSRFTSHNQQPISEGGV